jgi:DNA-binding NarL/FixJ family response regulator
MLTPREIDIVRLVAQAKPNSDIAAALGLSTGTVKIYLSRIFAKLHMRNRTALALWASQILPTLTADSAPHPSQL